VDVGSPSSTGASRGHQAALSDEHTSSTAAPNARHGADSRGHIGSAAHRLGSKIRGSSSDASQARSGTDFAQ
jgi:hypothetical protein